MLDGVIVDGVLSDFGHIWDLRRHAHLSTFSLLTVDWSCHIQILLHGNLWLWRVGCSSSLCNHSLVGILRLLQVSAHPHLLLEIDFS